MLEIVQAIKKKANSLIRLLPLLSFIIPFLLLYFLYPDSFETTWKGRTYYLFFLWLFLLEMILGWNELQAKRIDKVKSARTIALIIVLLIPTVYVTVANFFGLNSAILDLAKKSHIEENLIPFMPLSVEYLVLTSLSILVILLAYGVNGLKNLSISALFLGSIGAIYMIDNLYPFGRFTPFQLLVPTTTVLAANVLNFMGFKTSMSFISNPVYGSMPYLEILDTQPPTGFGIAWPCSGIDSLIIYTLTILLFLKRSTIPWKHKVIYFTIGAVVTYFINILRIVSIFLIAIDYGIRSTQVELFHNYYGPLYSTLWIIFYPFIVIGSRALWEKTRNWKTDAKNAEPITMRVRSPKQKYK